MAIEDLMKARHGALPQIALYFLSAKGVK